MPEALAWLQMSLPWSWVRPSRSVNVGNIIAEHSTSITIKRNGVELDAQTVRIEMASQQDMLELSEVTKTAHLDILILGYKNHPSITDTDLQRGDRFSVEGSLFEIDLIFVGFTDRIVATGNLIR